LKNKEINILIVDDSEIIRLHLFYKLKDEFDPKKIFFSETIEEAWDTLQKKPIDIILLDIYFPGKNGADLINDLLECERLKHIPIIVITGTREDSFVKLSYEQYVHSYLHKPVDDIALKKAIYECLEQQPS